MSLIKYKTEQKILRLTDDRQNGLNLPENTFKLWNFTLLTGNMIAKFLKAIFLIRKTATKRWIIRFCNHH
jgi:hypothetical protein